MVGARVLALALCLCRLHCPRSAGRQSKPVVADPNAEVAFGDHEKGTHGCRRRASEWMPAQ